MRYERDMSENKEGGSSHIHTLFKEVTIQPNHPTKHDWIPLLFLNLVLQTAFIPSTKVLSTLLISHAGLGKTIKLEYLRQFEFVKYSLDVTPKHIANVLDSADNGKIKFIVIPDYISTLGHSNKTVELARSIFRAMTEEGITDIDVYGMERHFKNKVKLGLISGITPEYFNQNSRVWKSDGFLSRFLTFSYSHSPNASQHVIQNIRDKVDSIDQFKMKVKIEKVVEPVRTIDIDKDIQLLTYSLLEPKEPPYRMYQQLIALANASAVLRDSQEVEKEDIDLITMLSTYLNRKEVPL